jgi:hypothetical protein
MKVTILVWLMVAICNFANDDDVEHAAAQLLRNARHHVQF